MLLGALAMAARFWPSGWRDGLVAGRSGAAKLVVIVMIDTRGSRSSSRRMTWAEGQALGMINGHA